VGKANFRFRATSLTKWQERLVLQMQHGKDRPQRLVEGNRGVWGTMIAEFTQIRLDGWDQCGEFCSWLFRSSGQPVVTLLSKNFPVTA
jgi:hypothetical protein